MEKQTLKSRIGQVLLPRLPISREAFDLFRFEWNAALVRTACKINPFKIRKVEGYVQQENLSVNVGAGPFGETGWVNIDLFDANNISFTYDCRRKLPFKNNTVSRIRCEHVFEHLDRVFEGPVFLTECFRCLKPGGVLRIVVPDAEKFIRAYYVNTAASWAELDISGFKDDWQPMDALNKIFHQAGEHKFGYDFGTLSFSIKSVGFKAVEKMEFGQSTDILLQNDQANHRHASLYVDCFK